MKQFSIQLHRLLKKLKNHDLKGNNSKQLITDLSPLLRVLSNKKD